MEASKENETECAKPKGVRRGYMGHITSISATLIQASSADAVIEKLLNDAPEWAEYVKGPLAQTRERESRRLADYVAPGSEKTENYDDDQNQSNYTYSHYAYFSTDFNNQDFTDDQEDVDDYENGYDFLFQILITKYL